MKLTYTEQFQLEGRGIKASGSANLQVEVDETTHGPLVDVLKAVVQALTAPVQTDGDKDDDPHSNKHTRIYGPVGEKLNVVLKPSLEGDGKDIHVVVYNFAEDDVIVYSDQYTPDETVKPSDEDAKHLLHIYAPKDRKIFVTFEESNPEDGGEAIEIEVRDALKAKVHVFKDAGNEVEGEGILLDTDLVVDAPYGRKVTLDVDTTEGDSTDIDVVVQSAVPMEITVTAYDEDVTVPDDVLHLDAPVDRKVTAHYEHVEGDTDDIRVVVRSNQHVQVALLPSVEDLETVEIPLKVENDRLVVDDGTEITTMEIPAPQGATDPQS